MPRLTIIQPLRSYRDDPLLLPAEWRYDGTDRVAAGRRIGDFIAGMTDRFARRAARAVPAMLRPRIFKVNGPATCYG